MRDHHRADQPAHGVGPASALARAVELIASRSEGGASRTDPSGVVSVMIPVPVAAMSGLIVSRPLLDPGELRALVDPFVRRGQPWSINVIGTVPDAVTDIAAELDLVRDQRPTLVAPLEPTSLTVHHDEEYRRVESVEDRAVFSHLSDTGFGFPAGTTAVVTTRSFFAEPSVRAFLAVRRGEPVGTALTVLDPLGSLSVFHVTTAMHVRRLGVADRLIRFVLADGVDRGAHTAQLQSSDMARAMYGRLGFTDAHDDLVSFAVRRPSDDDA
jgi:ribosomal protein S18 acetylase RimI-like enzyme